MGIDKLPEFMDAGAVGLDMLGVVPMLMLGGGDGGSGADEDCGVGADGGHAEILPFVVLFPVLPLVCIGAGGA